MQKPKLSLKTRLTVLRGVRLCKRRHRKADWERWHVCCLKQFVTDCLSLCCLAYQLLCSEKNTAAHLNTPDGNVALRDIFECNLRDNQGWRQCIPPAQVRQDWHCNIFLSPYLLYLLLLLLLLPMKWMHLKSSCDRSTDWLSWSAADWEAQDQQDERTQQSCGSHRRVSYGGGPRSGSR